LILRKPAARGRAENAPWIARRAGPRPAGAADHDGTGQLTNREVLVLDAAGSVAGTLAAHAGGERMIFRHARSIEQARRLTEGNRLDAAVAVLDGHSALPEDEVEALTATPCAADWIAIVDPKRLAAPSFQAFLLRSFHDHHTLPVDMPAGEPPCAARSRRNRPTRRTRRDDSGSPATARRWPRSSTAWPRWSTPTPRC
jgi:hypothetical protein